MDDIYILVLKNYVGTLANTESIIEKTMNGGNY